MARREKRAEDFYLVNHSKPEYQQLEGGGLKGLEKGGINRRGKFDRRPGGKGHRREKFMNSWRARARGDVARDKDEGLKLYRGSNARPQARKNSCSGSRRRREREKKGQM